MYGRSHEQSVSPSGTAGKGWGNPLPRCLNNAATITATIIQDLRANFSSCNYSDLQNSLERDKCPVERCKYTKRF